MATLARLMLELDADSSGLEAKTKRAEKSVSSLGKSIERVKAVSQGSLWLPPDVSRAREMQKAAEATHRALSRAAAERERLSKVPVTGIAATTATTTGGVALAGQRARATGSGIQQGMAFVPTPTAAAQQTAVAMKTIDMSIERTSRQWTVLRNSAERELLSVEKSIDKARRKLNDMLLSGKAVKPFSVDSGEADRMIKDMLRSGFNDEQISNTLAVESATRNASKGAATYAAAQAEVSRYSAAVNAATGNVAALNQKIEESRKAETIAKRNADAQKQFATAIKKVEHATGRSVMMFAKVAIGAASLYRLVRKLARAFWESLTANQELNASIAQIKGNLAVAWQAIFSGMLPALQALSNWLIRATSYIALFLLTATGMSWEEGVAAAQKQADAIGGVGAAAKKAKGDLAGFDAINRLASQAAGGGGGGITPADYSAIAGITDNMTSQWTDLLNLTKQWGFFLGVILWYWGQIKFLAKAFWDYWKPSFEEWAASFQRWKDNISKKFFDFFMVAIPKELKAAWMLVNKVWDIAVRWFADHWQKPTVKLFADVLSFIHNIFSGIGAWFGTKFGEAKTAIITAFSGVVTYFQNLWAALKSIFTSTGTSIAGAITSVFKSAINSVLAYAEKTINGFITNINNAIKLVNRIPGVNVSSVKPISIPRMAAGGIVTRPTMSVIGERGPEAVIPLNNKEFMREFAAMLSPMLQTAGAGGYGDIYVQLGEDALYNAVTKTQQRRAIRSNGRGVA